MIEAWQRDNGVVPMRCRTRKQESLLMRPRVDTDMELDSGIVTCGKDGQCVPAGVGQRTLKIDGLTVGGTA